MTRKQRAVVLNVRESAVLAGALDLVRYHPKVAKAWRQNNGAVKIEGRYVRFTDEPGVPDICGFMKDGRGLYIEVKAPGGRLTYWQSRFLESAAKSGCVCGVARSVEDVLQILEERQVLAA